MSVADDLLAVLEEAAGRHHVPGAAAGVVVDGEVHVATTGVTSAEHRAPVEEGTLFQVGSVSKTLTAALVVLLAEDGALDLADPVARHLPDLAATSDLDLGRTTVEHLLSHQAGFDGDVTFTRGATALADLDGARRLFAPGEGFSYSNAGFTLAGAVVEAVSGRPFAAVLRDRLLGPLGMGGVCTTADEAITHSVALPHWVFDGEAHVIRGAGWQPGWELRPLDVPAGGLVASIPHLLTWGRAQLTGGGEDGAAVLGPAARARLHAPVTSADGHQEVALDWFVRRTDGTTTIEHGGLTAGYATDLVVVPERGVVVACATHATNGAAVNQAVRRWALEHVADVRERDPAPDPEAAADPAALVGRYDHSLAELTVEVGPERGTVLVTSRPHPDRAWQPPPDPPVALAFTAADHLVGVDGTGPTRVVRAGLDGDGRAEWLLWGLRRAPRIG